MALRTAVQPFRPGTEGDRRVWWRCTAQAPNSTTICISCSAKKAIQEQGRTWMPPGGMRRPSLLTAPTTAYRSA
ncbi:unnamed protein product, partial [Pylaiella littoralis]